MRKTIGISIILFFIIFTTVTSTYTQALSVHRVKPGEDLYQIAHYYGITENEIASLNKLKNPDTIFNGQVLIIPNIYQAGTYRVKTGDTLFKISQKIHIPINILSRTNHINNETLYPHQLLYIPVRYRYPLYYQVKAGDTIYKLAREYGIETTEITVFNQLKSTELQLGQTLKIPVIIPGDSYNYNGPNYIRDFPDTFYRYGNTNQYKIAITFDDGPDGTYTPWILDILKKYNVPATFFLMGKRINNYPEVVKRIIAEGHIVASHSWSHPDLTKLSPAELSLEIDKTEKTLAGITGLKTKLVRPPYGAVSSTLLERMKEFDYKVINWTVDSRDWLDRDVDQILINTLPNIDKDTIILFHSAGGENHDLSATAEMLPEFIQTLQMLGYQFVNLDELLGINVYE
ncbi:LysM peptidoglycan-binding domain-containing protein [Halocella sp. SP3-1]|uniref:LysM peptidoglycan-binding domain-containing protein n=1 Tax=Halocella sp. SP3-1 TaxID=2382161 RepID=UPI000F75405F|nr:LysM peptidoglycan-binding domain-containing protein [Halocella sp. SP3-1]AZO94781.1 LysM peptidoglycan-binding domain-containing protein [Halocella sp. SP3-1]